jgi:hypothetical protein
MEPPDNRSKYGKMREIQLVGKRGQDENNGIFFSPWADPDNTLDDPVGQEHGNDQNQRVQIGIGWKKQV